MLDPWYVTGFCDGEATFTYSRSGGSFNLYFSLRQREGNYYLLEKIQEFFGYIGTIYRNKEGSFNKKSAPSQPPSAYSCYRVAKVDELKRVIGHFDKHALQGRKKDTYLIWRKMVMHKIENYRASDYDILRGLAKELAQVKSKK